LTWSSLHLWMTLDSDSFEPGPNPQAIICWRGHPEPARKHHPDSSPRHCLYKLAVTRSPKTEKRCIREFMCRPPGYTVGTSLTVPLTIHLWKWRQYWLGSGNKKLNFKITSGVLRASNYLRNASIIAFDDLDNGLLFDEVSFSFTAHLPGDLSTTPDNLSTVSSDTSDDDRGTAAISWNISKHLALILMAGIYWGVLQVVQGGLLLLTP